MSKIELVIENKSKLLRSEKAPLRTIFAFTEFISSIFSSLALARNPDGISSISPLVNTSVSVPGGIRFRSRYLKSEHVTKTSMQKHVSGQPVECDIVIKSRNVPRM
uniref:Uncharacterized protein n=1 Tax=Arion vulgaris TaxID=1028688 RepID=A0A0B7ACU8_9EUPU